MVIKPDCLEWTYMTPSDDPVAKTFIGSLGMGEKVRQLLREHGGSARAIVPVLSRDPDFRAAIALKNPDRRKLLTQDIHEYLTAESLGEQMAGHRKEIMELSRSGAAKPDLEVSTRTREQFLKMTALADQWWSIADRAVHILEDDMVEYVEEKEMPTVFNSITGEPVLPKFPVELLDNARKAVLASLDIVGRMKNDPVVKNVVNAENVTVQQGMSVKEFHQALFDTAKELGITQSVIVEAYGRAQAKRNGQTIIDAVPFPPKPAWREPKPKESISVPIEDPASEGFSTDPAEGT